MKFYLWHRFAYRIIVAVLTPLTRIVLGYHRVKHRGPDVPSIIIANHNGEFDAALVAVGFRKHMYFVSSEHVLRQKSRLAVFSIKYIANPIPINKTFADIVSIKEILKRVKAGASVCIFAEGDRASYGTTEPIPLSTAKLIKSSKAQLITYRIVGGYLSTPLWGKNKRKGRITAEPVGIYSAAELKAKTNEQVLEIIERDIYENATERQNQEHILYKGEDLAEHIELVLYICPECKRVGTIKSSGDRFWCSCGLDAVYTESGEFFGDKLKFKTIDEWARWQIKELADIIEKTADVHGTDGGTDPICSDEEQSLYIIDSAKKIDFAGKGAMYIDHNVFHCAGSSFKLSDITRFSVSGSMTLMFSTKDGTSYEVHSPHPRSALKYKEIFGMLNKG